MAIISQDLELMKPDYFHYLPLRWRQSESWYPSGCHSLRASGHLRAPVQGVPSSQPGLEMQMYRHMVSRERDVDRKHHRSQRAVGWGEVWGGGSCGIAGSVGPGAVKGK